MSKFLNILFFFLSFAAKWKGRVAVKALLSRPKVKVKSHDGDAWDDSEIVTLAVVREMMKSRNLAMFKKVFDSQRPHFSTVQIILPRQLLA